MHGVFLDFDTVSRGDLDDVALRTALGSLAVHGTTSPEQLAARLRAAEVVFVNKVVLDRAALDAAPRLRLVCLAATGYDNVDVAHAGARGIAVCNLHDYCTASVAQHVFALLLHFNQQLDGFRALVAARAWERAPQFTLLDLPIHELGTRTLGLVGYGTLGREVARIAQAFGMRVLVAERRGAAPRPGRTVFAQVLAAADYLSLHCPLTAETRGLIGAAELAALRADAVLINTARGAVVDEAALAAALRAGRLRGAAIDVLSQEPPVAGNPLLEPGVPNLLITPHIAWAAREARQRAVDGMAANCAAFRRGERLNRVV